MRMLACLVCIALVLLSPSRLQCQERGGSVRLRVTDERGTPQTDETSVYTESHALLIGNSVYADGAWSDLPDVAEDIDAVKEVLERQHGFKVEVALNKSRDALLRVIDQFISRHGQRYDNRLLIYYSGHGYTALLPDERRMGYLVMPEAPAMPPEESALRTPPTSDEFERFLPAAITMDDIESYARRITARHALFVFDSCFSGTVLYKDLGVGVPSQITTEELKPVRAYLTAGNETQRVPAYSRFRRKFVAALSGAADTNGDGYILASELGRWVSIEVERDTGRRQTPVFGKSDVFRRGDMIFVSPKKVTPVVAALEPPTPPEARPASPPEFRTGEQLFWQEMNRRNTAAAYESYLSEYPHGDFARVARLRLGDLKWAAFKPVAQKVFKYDLISAFHDDLAEVRVGDTLSGRQGFIDRAGNEVIATKYLDIRSRGFSEGLAGVEPYPPEGYRNDQGFIDQKGVEAVPFKYDFVGPFSEGLAWVQKGPVLGPDTRVGFVDKTGKEVIPLKYEDADSFSEGLARVRSNHKYGFIDKSGKEVLPLQYDDASRYFSEGLALVKLGYRYFYIDRTGAKQLDVDGWADPFRECFSFSEGLACYADGKSGFIDKSGKIKIAARYDWVYQFKDGLAEVRLNDKSGFIDRDGKVVVPLKYDAVWRYEDGLAKVRIGEEKNGKYGLINRVGQEILPPKYDEIWCEAFRKEGFIGVILNGRKGFVDIYGNEYLDLSNFRADGGAAAQPTPPPPTTSPALTDKPNTSPSKTTPARVSFRRFAIGLEACGISGKDAVCQFTVENQSDEQREFGISHNNWHVEKGVKRLGATQASDGLGNDYYLAESTIGSHRYTQSLNNLAVLAPRESVKLSLRFAKVPAGSTSFTLLRVAVAERTDAARTGELHLSNADFKNVPITR